MGSILFSEKQFEKALPLFQSVVQQEPDHVSATYRLAQTYFHLNQPEKGQEALELYKKLQDLERSRRKQLYDEPQISQPIHRSQ